jgi:hypothetical protein
MSLRERCKKFCQKVQRDVTLGRNPNMFDELTNFVVSEIGRAADSSLEDTLPLCLYFASERDRDEFLLAIHEAKPGMIAKRWP